MTIAAIESWVGTDTDRVSTFGRWDPVRVGELPVDEEWVAASIDEGGEEDEETHWGRLPSRPPPESSKETRRVMYGRNMCV